MKDYIHTQLKATARMLTVMQADRHLILTLESCARACVACLQRGGKILLAGNGGSAAEAQHIAAEFVNRFVKDRRGLPAIALTTDTSLLTAISNDYGYEQLFARQIQVHGQMGDFFIAYSTSGQSVNILRALDVARNQGMICVGMTGMGDSLMREKCDFLLEIPAFDTPNIQEGHLILGHIFCGLVEEFFFRVTS